MKSPPETVSCGHSSRREPQFGAVTAHCRTRAVDRYLVAIGETAATRGSPGRGRRPNSVQFTTSSDSVAAGFARRGTLPDLVSRLRNYLVRADATVMRVALTLWAAALLVGCSAGWTSGGELRDGAFSLVPPQSSIVEEVAADCVELAPSPSCVHLYFLAPPTPLERRTRLVEAAAATSGWERIRLETFPGGNIAHYRRGGFDARVYLRTDEATRRCRRAPHRDCADAIMVE
jgi:hypothetical protein